MSEQLFKLKKDGECVGYCKLVKYRDPLDTQRTWSGWAYSKDCGNKRNWEQRAIIFDTAHPYVTTDKNGNKVFAGDECKFVFEQGTYLDVNGLQGIIKKDNFRTWITLKYSIALRKCEKEYYPEESEWQHLELIKDKEDE